MTSDAKFLAVGKRLARFRQAYVAVAAGQRRSWLLFYDRLEQLIDAANEAARVTEVDLDALNVVYRHAIDGLRIYERRRTIARAELLTETEHVTRTLIAFWQF